MSNNHKSQEKGLLSTTFNQMLELDDSELDSIAGGGLWDKFKEGVRDAFQGVSDGINGRNRQESNLNYLGGHIGGSLGSLVGFRKRK